MMTISKCGKLCFVALVMWALGFGCIAALFSGCDAHADSLARKCWNVELSDPASYDVEIYRGETLYLQPSYLLYSEPVPQYDVIEAKLRYRTDGMTPGYYSVVTGTVSGSSLVFLFRAQDCPTGSVASYTIVGKTLKGDTARGFGRLKFKGIVDGSETNQPREITSFDWSAVEHLNRQDAPFLLKDDPRLGTFDRAGLAVVCGYPLITNAVSYVEGGSSIGGEIVLSANGSVVFASPVPIARIALDVANEGNISHIVEERSGSVWSEMSGRDTSSTNIFEVRVRSIAAGLPSMPDITDSVSVVTVSAASLWTWDDPALAGTTNDMRAARLLIADPGDDEDAAVNLRTMNGALDKAGEDAAAEWAGYTAKGKKVITPGVDVAGLPLRLDNRYTILAEGGCFALVYNGSDILRVTPDDVMVRIAAFSVTPSPFPCSIPTNGCDTAPRIQTCSDLVVGAWLNIAATSSWPSAVGENYRLTYSNTNESGIFFRCVRNGTNGAKLSCSLPFSADGGLILGNVKRTSWPDGYNTLAMFRYAARTNAGSEIMVAASGTGIVASVSGSLLTLSVPAGVVLQSARIRWPGSQGTALTVDTGSTDMENTSLGNRWGCTMTAFREDTGARLTTASVSLDLSSQRRVNVAGLYPSAVNHLILQW